MEWNGFSNDMARKHGSLRTTMHVFCHFMTLPLTQTLSSILSYTFRNPCMTWAWCMDVFSFTGGCLLQLNRSVDISPSNSRMSLSIPGNSYHAIIHQLHCWGDGRCRFRSVCDCPYGRLNGIFNGKSCVKAFCSYHTVASSHLKKFPSTGPKWFEPKDEYLDTAWAHLTGPHWVYNFLLSTLLIH